MHERGKAQVNRLNLSGCRLGDRLTWDQRTMYMYELVMYTGKKKSVIFYANLGSMSHEKSYMIFVK